MMNTREFYDEFEMRVRTSHHRLRRMKPKQLRSDVWNNHLTDELVWNLTEAAEEVECVEVLMPRDKLEELMSLFAYYERMKEDYRKSKYDLVAEMREDERVRIQYPNVQQAWDHYHTLLNLCRD